LREEKDRKNIDNLLLVWADNSGGGPFEFAHILEIDVTRWEQEQHNRNHLKEKVNKDKDSTIQYQ
jgi:hypothetical protein